MCLLHCHVSLMKCIPTNVLLAAPYTSHLIRYCSQKMRTKFMPIYFENMCLCYLLSIIMKWPLVNCLKTTITQNNAAVHRAQMFANSHALWFYEPVTFLRYSIAFVRWIQYVDIQSIHNGWIMLLNKAIIYNYYIYYFAIVYGLSVGLDRHWRNFFSTK